MPNIELMFRGHIVWRKLITNFPAKYVKSKVLMRLCYAYSSMVLMEELLSVVMEKMERPWSQAILNRRVFAAYGSMAEEDITMCFSATHSPRTLLLERSMNRYVQKEALKPEYKTTNLIEIDLEIANLIITSRVKLAISSELYQVTSSRS